MFTVIGSAANRSFRVLWMMEELGVEYEHVAANPRSDEAKAFVPTGKMPAIKIGDEIYTDSVAILTFLADKHNALTFPAGSVERLTQDGHMQFVNEELDSVLWTAAKNKFILPEDVRMPEIDTSLKWEFTRSLERLEERLGDGPFLMGDTFTIADIIAVHCLNWAFAAKFPAANDRVKAYSKAARSREAYRRAYALREA